jgi:hypothetical protein
MNPWEIWIEALNFFILGSLIEETTSYRQDRDEQTPFADSFLRDFVF